MELFVFVLACFVTLVSVNGSSVQRTRYYGIGDTATIGEYHGVRDDYDSPISKCELRPNGEKDYLTLYSKNSNDNKYYDKFALDFYEKCKVSIHYLNKNDTGLWSIRVLQEFKNGTKKSFTEDYELFVKNVYDEKPSVPDRSVVVFPERDLTIKFKDNLKEEKCKLLNPKGFLVKDAQKLDSGCGFKIKVTDDSAGTWTLIADINKTVSYYSHKSVYVQNMENMKVKEMNYTLRNGKTEAIDVGPENVKFCIFEGPQGEKYPIKFGRCHYQLDVTKLHEGTWKIYYALQGLESLVEQVVNVHVYDPVNLKNEVIYNADNSISLLCQVSNLPAFCYFITPNRTIIHMTPGIGDKKYEYYGNGSSRYNDLGSKYDCGIKILQPNPTYDYGSWKCMTEMDGRITGTILKVQGKKTNFTNTAVSAESVKAKIGTSYKLKCEANEVLDYCWFRSPNGSYHSVIKGEKVKLPALKYVGLGLELGDCSAEVPVANESDNGQWSCHVGITNRDEVVRPFDVVVSETELDAESYFVKIEKKSKTELLCKQLPTSNKVIDSCRWVSPRGRGINSDFIGRYKVERNISYCKLTIAVINLEEDVGVWSCYTRYANVNENKEELVEEGRSQIMVYYQSSFSSSKLIAINISISVLTAVCVSVLIYYLWKKKRALRQEQDTVMLTKPAKFP
ncbi:hypothetical protein TKK_0014809 [Trichogramma kaykai]|uniref:Ig-like domain-containing protein n=1 Tax=Trichogramma kaykai TaxID=54128 RepID=A0ABD2WCR7_9HYME